MTQSFSNGLNDAEAERLAILLEEFGEAQQAVGKILRHGYESYDPSRDEEMCIEGRIAPTWKRSSATFAISRH